MINQCKLLNEDFKKPIEHIYIGDLLSVVMGNIKTNSIWITVQKSMNVIAIGELSETSVIIFVHGIEPEQDVIDKATECKITLYSTKLSAYEMAVQLKESGI